MIVLFYYFVIFILGLFLLGRSLSGPEFFADNDQNIVRSYITVCIAFVAFCVLTVGVGVSPSDVADKVFLYLTEFIRMAVLINCAELCAVFTNRKKIERRAVFVVTSELFYFGTLILIIRTIINKAEIKHGIFGTQFVMGRDIGTVLNIVLNIVILFFYGAYTYSFYYSCTKKREMYIFRRCMYMVSVLAVCLFIESIGYLEFGEYIPSMIFGMIYCIFIYKNLLQYRRKIEYNEDDYMDILSPTCEKAAFVCNDEGIVIFENTRAFVMRQMYRDSYKGNYLSDFFDMSMLDIERLRNPSLVNPFEIYCNYRKDTREVKLTVRHKLDRYSEIFSSEVEVEFMDQTDDENDINASLGGAKKAIAPLSQDDKNNMRIKSLIYMIDSQKRIYADPNKLLFLMNLKGITKMAEILKMPSLIVLSNSIREEVDKNVEWESIEEMMVDLDRQNETLKFLT